MEDTIKYLTGLRDGLNAQRVHAHDTEQQAIGALALAESILTMLTSPPKPAIVETDEGPATTLEAMGLNPTPEPEPEPEPESGEGEILYQSPPSAYNTSYTGPISPEFDK